jgi:hypothetical protein
MWHPRPYPKPTYLCQPHPSRARVFQRWWGIFFFHLASLCWGGGVYGQPYAMPKDYKASNTYIFIKTLSFLHNSEYFNPFVEGQTLAGFQLQPWIGHHPTPYFGIQGGAFCRRYWGEKRFFSTWVRYQMVTYNGL